MPASKAHQKASNKWISKAYDRVNLTLPKGQKDVVQSHAAANGESVNGFIGRAINETIEHDKTPDAPEGPWRERGAPQSAGVVSLPSDALKCAQGAAVATGEGVTEFVCRAVKSQAKRDNASLRMGINPATGEKLEKQNNETEAKP